MATSYTGLRVQDTYNAIIKIGDNSNLTSTPKLLSDGLGNDSPLYLSGTRLGIGISPAYQFHTSGNAKIGGDVIISGDLTVNGDLTYLNVTDLAVEDPLIKLAKDNTANTLDIGLFGKYVATGTKYKGFFNDASDDKFKLFIGTTVEPTTTVDISASGYTVGTLVANLEGNVTGNLTGNVTGNVTGNLTGNVTGNLTGNVTGNVTGDLTGNVSGGTISGTTGTFSSRITAQNGINVTGGSTGADIYINNTSPTLGFTDSNSFTDSDDIYIVRGTSNDSLQFQWYDNSASTTTQTFIIDSSGNATFEGQVTIPQTPTADTHAASKKYVDDEINDIDFGQTKAYSITDTGGTAQWAKLGTFTAPQSGVVIKLQTYLHAGYNASNGQDIYMELFFKTSNGNSVNSDGFAGNSWYNIVGEKNHDLTPKWVANNSGVNATTYDLYVYLPIHTSGSYYEVTFELSTVVSWNNNQSGSQTDPGNGSATVLESLKSFTIQGSGIFTENLNIDGNLQVDGTIKDSDGDAGTSGQLLSSTGTGTNWIDFEADVAKRIDVTVKNVSGGSLAKGTVVHAAPTATPPSGNVIEVIAADANVAASMPAIGVLNETIADEAEGEAVMFGAVSGIDTSGFSIGDELYVSETAGEFTATKPTAFTSQVQKIAVVIKSHASNGLIKVFGAGRTNDVPNRVDRDMNFTDGSKLEFGTDSDLEIYHDGTDGYIDNINGDLIIQNKSDDKDIVFKSDNGSGDVIEYFRVDGSTNTIPFGRSPHIVDNVKLYFGTNTADDASIKWDSTADLLFIDGDTKFLTDTTVVGNITSETSGGNHGIKVITAADAEGFLIFGDAADNSMGGMAYNNSTNSLDIDCNNGVALSFNSSRAATFHGNITPNADSSHNLGSSSVRWANLYADYLYGNGSNVTNVNATTIDGFDSIKLYREVYRDSWSSGTTTKYFVIEFPFISGSGSSAYYYLDVFGHRDIGQMDSQLHYRLYIHNRADGVNNNTIDVDLFIMNQASGEFFDFYHLSGGSSASKIYIEVGEDYSGIIIGQLPSNNYISSSNVTATETEPTGYTQTSFATTRVGGDLNLLNGDLNLVDDSTLGVGTSNDLFLIHDQTNSIIGNTTGNLIIRNDADDADIIFQSDNGSGGRIEYFRLDGSTSTVPFGRSPHLQDNLKLYFGSDTATDASIRWESSASQLFIDGTSKFLDDLTVLKGLDVTHTSSDAVFLRSSQATTTNVYITNTNATTSNTANLYFAPANNIAGSYIRSTAIEDFSVTANRTADLRFAVRKDGTFNEAVIIDSSGNVQMNRKLDIGTYVELYDYAAGTTVANRAGYLKLESQAKTGWAPGDEHGKIIFYGRDTSGVGARNAASIRAVNENGNGSTTTTFSGALAFYTSAYNSFEEEALRIDSSGNATFAGDVDITGDLSFGGGLTFGRTIGLSSTDYCYITGDHTNGGDGDWLMRMMGYVGSTYYGSVDILRHDSDDGEIRFRTRIAGTATDVMTIVDGHVGINDTTPDAKLDVELAATNTYSKTALNTPNIIVSNTNSSNVNSQASIISLRSTGWSGSTTGVVNIGAIQAGNANSAHFVVQTRNAGSYGERFRIASDGRIGFGVSPFAHSLGTSVNIDLLGNGGIWGYAGATYVNSNAYYDSGWKYKSTNPAAVLQVGGSSQTLTFRQAASGTAGAAITFSQPFTIDANGNMGLHVTSPSSKLHIIDTSNPATTSGSVIIEGRRDGGANVLTLRAKDASAPGSALPNAQGAVLRWQGFDGTDFENMGYIYVAADGQAVANADAPSYMSFGTSGDGSSTPSEKLRITSDGKIQAQTSGGYYLTESTTNAFSITSNGANGYFKIRDEFNSSDRFYIDNSGNVIVGGTSYNGVTGETGFEIYGDTAQFLLNNPTYNHFTIYSAGDSNIYNVFGNSGNYLIGTGGKDTSGWSEKMRIDSSGRVGIGGPPTSTVRLSTRGLTNTSSDFSFEAANSSGNSLFLVRSDGNIGIHTTTPDASLDIEPSSGDADILLTAGSQTLRLDQNSIRTTTNSNLTLFTNGNSGQLVLQQSTGSVLIGGILDVAQKVNTEALGYHSMGAANSGGSARWVRLGTWSTAQAGRNIIITIAAGNGYNASLDQNGKCEIMIRTSNGGGTPAISGSFEVKGRNDFITAVTAVENSQTSYTVYAYCDTFIGQSFIKAEISESDAWDTNIANNSTPSGTMLSLTQETVFKNKVGILTNSPSYDLHVNGDGYFNEKVSIANAQPQHMLDVYSATGSIFAGRFVYAGTTSTVGVLLLRLAGGSTSPSYVDFIYGTTQTGYITTNGSGTIYGTSSDYRLKENVVELTGALDKLDNLQPKRFNFISTPEQTVDGFLAHEVAEVVPEAIHGEKDAVDEDGNIKAQAIDQSKLVPLLVAAVKELRAEVESLKSQINS